MVNRVWDLLERNAVMPVVGWEDRACVVHGRSGTYLVKAFSTHVECNCMAGQSGATCSHAAAAMIVWHEQFEARRQLPTRRD